MPRRNMNLLNDRFEILDEIGRGSQAVTYRARDHDSGDVVALKELDFRRVEDWKAQELFEREGKTLRGLEHPAIPKYVDAFAIEDDDQVKLYLAQEFIDGPTLQDELDRGERWSETRVRADALRLLDALDYLHALAPPVVHRDIKPSNIIRRADGGLALVDFGAVQNIVPKTVGGSTIIGTPGYMPIEQVMGRAVPASDMYALGATLIHLLTQTDPSDLPVERNRLKFRDQVPTLSDELAAVLDDLTEPSVEDRIDSASLARDRLGGPEVVKPTPPPEDGPTVVVSDDLPALHYPPWATVTHKREGPTAVSFNTFGLGGGRQYVTIEQKSGQLTLLAETETSNAPQATIILTGLAVMAVALFLLPVAGAIIALGIGFALSARIRESERKASSGTVCELQLTSNEYVVSGGDGRRKGRTKRIQNFDVDRGTLVLVDSNGGRIPLFSMTIEEKFRWTWLVPYLNRELQELRGETVFDLAPADEREEFWKAEPVGAEKKG